MDEPQPDRNGLGSLLTEVVLTGRRPGHDGRPILVADDSRDHVDCCAALLRMARLEVLTAYDGREALDFAGRFRPQVLLLDLDMPGLSGYEVAERIRSEPWGRGMRLIAVSGWGRERDKARTRAAGFERHLTKPADLESILALVMQPHAQNRKV